jgi:tetratricopeptide (TPR) repeat protein
VASAISQERARSVTAFVGRERELAELRAGLDDVSAGHGRLLLLSGEPGIGKTRLAEEISSDASARGMRVVWGRCWEGGGAPAYWPFIQILRACVEGLDAEHLKNLLGSDANEIARLIPEIRLSLPSLDEAKAATDSESARFRLFDAVATLLKNVARRAPLLLVVDDLHDADQPSLQMLRFVARETKNARILIIGTYRDVEVRQSPELGKLIGDLIREGRTVSIAGLSQAEVGEFIERSSAKKADDKLVADLYHATDGNPLFVDGVVRLLAAEGKLERSGFDGSAFKIPDGVRESIRRRLAALSDEANSLLSIASVIGNEFETRLLERVSGRSAEQIVAQTDEAGRIGILKTGAPSFTGRRFSHALIREVLYDDLAANRRIEWHGDIGAAIEEIYKSDLRPHLAQLAHHFTAARIARKAIDYSIDAGETAYRTFAYEDAALHWETAFQLMKDRDYAPERKARLLVGLGNLQYLTNPNKRDAKGIELLEQALTIYESLGRQDRVAEVHSRLGTLLTSRSSSITDIPRAAEHYRKAEEILGQGPDRVSLAAVYAGLATVALRLNHTDDGLAWSQRAMEMAERLGNDEIWTGAAASLGLHLFSKGKLADAISLVDATYERANRLNNVSSAHSAAWVAGFLRNFVLDPREGRGWFLRELAKPRVAQAPALRRVQLDLLACSHIDEGDLAAARKAVPSGRQVSGDTLVFYNGEWEQAESACQQSLDEFRKKGSRNDVEFYLHFLALICAVRGDLARAEALLKEALELSCVETDSKLPWQLKHRTLLALIYANTSRVADAHEHLTHCREILGNGEDWRGLVGVVARAEAVVAAAERRYQDAETRFEKSVQIFRRYHVPFEEAEALHYWGRALNAAGEHGRANEKLDAAIEIYRRCGAGARWVELVEADRPSSPARTEKVEPAAAAAVFCMEGDYWTISYEGKTWRLKDAKGFHYIAHLLGHPGEEIRALDLAALSGGAGEEVTDAANAEDLVRTGVLAGDLGHAGEMLDAQAKADYQRRLTELEDELEEARELGNDERIAKAEDEKEAVTREIRRAIGLGGRDRRAASSAERARVAVTRAIRLALARISEQNRDLGRLLATTIKTGAVCSYVPDDRFPVSWRL